MQERVEAPPPPPSDSAPNARNRRTTRFVGAALLLALTLWMIQSYLITLGWAVIIAISVWPLYRRVQARFGGSRIAAPLLVTACLAILLLVPIALALTEIGREGQFALQWLTNLQQNGLPAPDWVHRLPLVGDQLAAWWQAHLGRPQSAENS